MEAYLLLPAKQWNEKEKLYIHESPYTQRMDEPKSCSWQSYMREFYESSGGRVLDLSYIAF